MSDRERPPRLQPPPRIPGVGENHGSVVAPSRDRRSWLRTKISSIILFGALFAALAAVCAWACASPLARAEDPTQRTTVARLPADVKQAINRGLELFAKSQNADGSWGAGNRTGGTALGLMSFPNLLALIVLSGATRRWAREYMSKKHVPYR